MDKANIAGDGASLSISRRGFLRAIAATAVVGAGLPLLSACGEAAAPASGSAPASSAPASSAAASAKPAASAASNPAPSAAASTSAAKPSGALPSYIPSTTGPKPDFPSTGPLYEDGFTNYPNNPAKSWKGDPPGKGGKINIFTTAFLPVPGNPLDQNPAWQEINKQLNAQVSFSTVSQADFIAKFSAMMAGNDLPDISLVRDGTANLGQLLQAQAADLTPFLAGDAIKDYPNLAAIPTFAWKNGGAVQNGKLYMIPIERYAPGNTMFRNSEVYDAEIGPAYTPKNADDFKRVLLQLNKPAQGRWAIGAWQNTQFQFYAIFAPMFNVPNNWALDSSGKLTKDFEVPQFKEAVGYVRDLFAAGVFHPDSLTLADVNAGRAAFLSGKWILNNEIFGVAWQDLLQRGPKLKPAVTALPVTPFPAHDGGKPVHYLRPGYIAMNMLKKAPADRIKEVLNVMNWIAAPFGSAEDLLLTVGVKDIDYTLDANGAATPTAKSNADANLVNWKYHVQHPQVAFATGVPSYAKLATDFEKIVVPMGVNDPTWGLSSATNDSKGVPLTKAFTDGITDIIAGRRPLNDVDALGKDWVANGGEQIRKEYMQAIAAGA